MITCSFSDTRKGKEVCLERKITDREVEIERISFYGRKRDRKSETERQRDRESARQKPETDRQRNGGRNTET